jgi:peptide/nickel transport system permease protein
VSLSPGIEAFDAADELPAVRPRRSLRPYAGPLVGGAVLAVIVLAAILVPWLSPFGVDQQNLDAILRHPGWHDAQGHVHPFGTDGLGRDVMTRVFDGARYSLWISLVSVTGAFVIGTSLGLVAGYAGGVLDDVLMRICDVQLAFPLVLLALAIIALLGASVRNVIIVFVLTLWPVFARTIRGSTLILREHAFIEAARAIGASRTRIVLRHVLPSAAGPLVVVATFQFASVIIYESALGFLGLGVQPPTPTWGNMIAEGRQYLGTAWWMAFFPGAALVLTTMATNLIGDGVGRVLDPRQRRQT